MNKYNLISLAILMLLPVFPLRSQDIVEVDSLVYRPVSVVDPALEGKSLRSSLPYNVIVDEPLSLSDALDRHIIDNASKTINGYRIRIYFEASQNARTESEKIVSQFRSNYHGMNVYRSYTNPYFKVTVGDFRTKPEAAVMLRKIQREFPSAFIVREKLRFPDLDPESFVVDTVKIYRPGGSIEL